MQADGLHHWYFKLVRSKFEISKFYSIRERVFSEKEKSFRENVRISSRKCLQFFAFRLLAKIAKTNFFENIFEFRFLGKKNFANTFFVKFCIVFEFLRSIYFRENFAKCTQKFSHFFAKRFVRCSPLSGTVFCEWERSLNYATGGSNPESPIQILVQL